MTTVQPRPYTEESARSFERTTKEERIRTEDSATRARDILSECEPEHAREERWAYRIERAEGKVALAPHDEMDARSLSRAQWRSYWRSQPDYDGPPMRAPSGLVVRFPAVEGIDEAERAARRELRAHLRAQGYGLVYLDDDRHDGMRAYRRFGVQMLFDRPDEGGRGWCPKLAGVRT